MIVFGYWDGFEWVRLVGKTLEVYHGKAEGRPTSMENKVPNSIGTLDRISIAIKGVQEPSIMTLNQLPTTCISPEHIFPVRMEGSTRGAHRLPAIRQHVGLPGLVDDFGYVASCRGHGGIIQIHCRDEIS